MQAYRESFPVRIHMTDETGYCRAADMMRFLQESAIMQLEHNGPTHASLSAKGQAFMLSRFSIDFPVPVPYFETVCAETWPCSTSRGATFDRHFRIWKNDGKGAQLLAAQAASQGALCEI